MDRTTSSKVTVEYHDPSNVFSLISTQLLDRLPLRNLHWKAPTRPLRSIDSLHVDLVPSDETAQRIQSNGTASDSTAASGNEAKKSDSGSRDPSKVGGKERRHQIPGLRQTPYLKLYLLRCDDNDDYKANARRHLREWIKANSQSSGARAENHDASECLIFHVVMPGTPAASQPRWSGTSRDSTGAPVEKTSSGSRWPGRGSSTVYEKIRADFNETSKHSHDRVAQIRLPKELIPAGRLSAVVSQAVPDFKESPQEQENAWNDVIAKFKTLILSSFDRRVSQYEEDIRERDAQRSLPGWNFCTFFVLKEGLAMGFENVGLVEDALMIYDELSVGLDTVIQEEVAHADLKSSSFLDWTTELLDQLRAVQAGEGANSLLGPHPVDSRRKPYRDMIVSTNASIYDFRCYVFSRQMALLLRLGNAQSSRSELMNQLQSGRQNLSHQQSRDDLSLPQRSETIEPSEDLVPLTEVCERASTFITSTARDMRADFISGSKSQGIDSVDTIIDNMVASWMYSVAQQVLDETRSSALPISLFSKDQNNDSSTKLKSFGGRSDEQKASVPEPKTMIHPARSTSLANRRNSLGESPYAVTPQTSQVVYDQGNFQDAGRRREQMLNANNVALEDLAAHRAELYLIQRRLLEQVGKLAGWAVGWSALTATQSVESEPLSEVSLDDSEEEEEEEEEGKEEKEKAEVRGVISSAEVSSERKGLLASGLVQAMNSKETFRSLFENLSDMAFKHYTKANRIKAGERILGDLAALRFQLRDFTTAAMYFSKMAPLFAEARWNFVEMTMLKMYAKCVKELHRKGDYAHILLDILAKSAARWRACGLPPISRATESTPTDLQQTNWLDDDGTDTTGFLTELIASTSQLPTDQIVAMARYFDKVIVEPYAHYHDDRDGFKLRVSFRHLLEDTFEATRVRVRLVSATAAQSREIWLDSGAPVRIERGSVKTWVFSNVTTAGPHIVDKIQIESGKLKFVHEPFSKTEATTPLGLTSSVSATSVRTAKKSRIVLYPPPESFSVSIEVARKIEFGQPRFIEVQCNSGRNSVDAVELRIRAASAGLRLRTADAILISGTTPLESSATPGVIKLGKFAKRSSLTLQIPYDLELEPPDLVVRLEATFQTQNGEFVSLRSSTIPIKLPLDVKVDDHFKARSLFSRFNIETAHGIPLDVHHVRLAGTDDFEVEAPPGVSLPMTVFQRQPAAILYKITPRAKTRSEGKELPLALTVDYRRLDEDVLEHVSAIFTKALQQSTSSRLENLLVPALCERLGARILPAHYEKIAVLRNFTLGSFDSFAWTEVLEALPQSTSSDAEQFLIDWHQSHPVIALPDSSSAAASPPRQIIITVPIPRIHILSTVSLSLRSSTSHSSPKQRSSNAPLAAVGQPLSATLRIHHTRRWATHSSLASVLHIKEAHHSVPFVYEIGANPDLWLIGGQRRAIFEAKEDEMKQWEIVLVPLRQGNWMLPTVEVKVQQRQQQDRTEPGDTGARIETTQEEEVLCETDYLAQVETIMVVPDLRSTTVGIMGLNEAGSGTLGGTVVLESEGLGLQS